MKKGDRVMVKETGETGTLISTAQYNAISHGKLSLSRARYTRWVRFDKYSPNRPLVVGHCASELQVI